MYGGNGQTNFGLPNFQGRTANHVGSGFSQGQVSGEDNHTLTLSELPTHPHVGQVQPTNATTGVPTNSEVLAAVPSFAYRTSVTNTTTLEPTMISKVGGSQPHSNQQPYLVLNFVIALQGVFPSRN